MKYPTDYNVDLDITLEQVESETDIEKLHNWRNTLNQIINEIYINNPKTNKK